jgi:hypothetical protein
LNVQGSNVQGSTFKVQRSNVQGSNVQGSTFKCSTFIIIIISGFEQARERTHRHQNAPRPTFNVPTFNVQKFNLHHYNWFHTRSYWQYYTSGVTNYVLAPTSFTAAQWYSLVHHPTYQEQ